MLATIVLQMSIRFIIILGIITLVYSCRVYNTNESFKTYEDEGVIELESHSYENFFVIENINSISYVNISDVREKAKNKSRSKNICENLRYKLFDFSQNKEAKELNYYFHQPDLSVLKNLSLGENIAKINSIDQFGYQIQFIDTVGNIDFYGSIFISIVEELILEGKASVFNKRKDVYVKSCKYKKIESKRSYKKSCSYYLYFENEDNWFMGFDLKKSRHYFDEECD